jgi:hypothetical protein
VQSQEACAAQPPPLVVWPPGRSRCLIRRCAPEHAAPARRLALLLAVTPSRGL